ncbi:MAG: hypothetical protein K2H46_00135 [Muribaculaceae bacterium]|nr:hypothetical protein [Muribaculaceae bacterium]
MLGIKEKYVSYDQAVALKRLGFAEKISHYYVHFRTGEIKLWRSKSLCDHNKYTSPNDVCSAPRIDQAAAWMRDCKELHVLPRLENVNKPDYVCIVTLMRKESIRITDDDRYFPDYESALSAGLDAALELLGKEVKE